MSAPTTITTLSGVQLDGTCKLTADQIKTSTDNTITFPSGGGTLATTDDVANAGGSGGGDLSNYATLTGTETLTNKTLTNPTILTMNDGKVNVPTDSGTLALAYYQDHGNKSLSSRAEFTSGSLNVKTINLSTKLRIVYFTIEFTPSGTTNPIKFNPPILEDYNPPANTSAYFMLVKDPTGTPTPAGCARVYYSNAWGWLSLSFSSTPDTSSTYVATGTYIHHKY